MIGKKFKNNVTVALHDFYAKKGKIYPAYVSNINREKQVSLLMISSRE